MFFATFCSETYTKICTWIYSLLGRPFLCGNSLQWYIMEQNNTMLCEGQLSLWLTWSLTSGQNIWAWQSSSQIHLCFVTQTITNMRWVDLYPCTTHLGGHTVIAVMNTALHLTLTILGSNNKKLDSNRTGLRTWTICDEGIGRFPQTQSVGVSLSLGECGGWY